MLVALMAYDKDGALELRKANRDAHVAYLKSSDLVRQAGPFLNAGGEMCGSLIILEVTEFHEDIARYFGSKHAKNASRHK